MKQVADQVARWLGILSSGVLDGEDAERSLVRAHQVLGEERLGELREWFRDTPAQVVADAKRAVVEACVAVVHADEVVTGSERELVARIVQLAALDPASARSLEASIDAPLPLDQIAPRIPHPALRELVLVIAWQIAQVDEDIDGTERGTYGELAKRLAITPARAKELRGLFEAA